MFYRLLLVDGQGGARAPPLLIRILRQIPDLDGLSVHFRRVRNDGLFESARAAGALAYQILRGEGIVRSQVWVEYEVPGEHLSVAGRSSDLLFALALITSIWSADVASDLTVAATGILDHDGTVRGVDRPIDKISAAVEAMSAAGHGVIFYPSADREAVESWRGAAQIPRRIELRPVEHIDAALAYFGYGLEKVYLRNPFRGLEHFNYEHHAIFFGREREVRELVQRLLRREAASTAGLLIEGPSGSGKSSLVRAGLLPALIEPRHQPDAVRSLLAPRPVSRGARWAVWRPGLLSAGATEGALAQSIRDCWGAFAEFPRNWREVHVDSLAELANRRREQWPVRPRFVWLIDQFEEILSLRLDEALFEAFGRFLAALQADNAWTLISVRADAMPTIKRYAAIREVFGANEGQYYLTSLSGMALADVITCPAKAAGLTFGVSPEGRGLDQLLLEEAYKESDSLPLLQFTLNELYLKRSGSELSYETFRQLGGLAGSIATTATTVLEADPIRSRQTFPRLCRSLVSVDESGRATRRYSPISEIDADLMPLVKRLVDARLCVSDERVGQAVVAFAHDSLLHTFPALTDWLREEAGLLQTRELAERDASLWLQHRQADAWLAASDRLIAFKGLEAAGITLSTEVRSFIDRSERQMRRRARIRQAVVGLICVLATAASIGAWIATRKEREAERQSAQTMQAQLRLMTEAASERLKDGDLAYARGIILEVLKQEGATGLPSPAAVNVFQEIRAADPASAILSGHEASVLSASYSPDGTRIVTASADHTARIWDARSGIELRALSDHRAAVKSAVYSPDGTRIATASRDGTARIWHAQSGVEILVINDPDSAGAWLDSRQINDAWGFSSVAFAPDNTRIVTAGRKVGRVWDARTGAQLAVLEGHRGDLTSASYSPDGRHIVTSSADRTARVWDAHNGALLMVLSGHGDTVVSAEYSPDGRHIVTASNDNTARVWDALTGANLVVLSGHVGYVWHATYSPDGATIATIGTDKTARIWSASGALIKVLPGHVGILYKAAYSPDGSHLVTASYDRTARVWKLGGSSARILAGHSDRVTSVAYSPDGTQLVTGSEDRTARIWDARSGSQLHILAGHSAVVNSAAYSADGTRIVTSSADKSARIWDARTGASLLSIVSKNGSYSAAFSPDGSRIVIGSRLSFGVWNAQDGTLIVVRPGHTDDLTSTVYSPDGTRILTASDDKSARIWDSREYRQLHLLAHDEFVNDARYSGNGARVVTASDDRTARIWDARTGLQLQVLLGNHAYVQSAALSDDGSRVVTGGMDHTVRIYDARTGTELAVLLGHSDRLLSVAYSPDGTHVASASADKTARIWDAAVPAELSSQLAWANAAEADPITEVQRSQLGLPPATALLTDATVGAGFGVHLLTRFSPSTTGITGCAREAGAFYDPDRSAPGLAIASINAEIAGSACGRAAAAPGASAQTIYQAGRALLAKGDYRNAREYFEHAISLGYPAANVDLATMLLNPAAKMLNYPRATALLKEAWARGVPIAAFELGRLYESGVAEEAGAGAVPADSLQARFWYEKGVSAHEPNSIARRAERYETQAVAEGDNRDKHSSLLEALKLYTVAVEVARAEEWPDPVWTKWRYRRASLARELADEGMMQQAAEAYNAALARIK